MEILPPLMVGVKKNFLHARKFFLFLSPRAWYYVFIKNRGVISLWLDKLREMKNESGLTTKEIAHLSKIPEPTLEKIFSGATKDPKLETMRQLVRVFDRTLDDLDDSQNIRKSPFTIEMNGLDRNDREIIMLLRKLTPDQKVVLIAALKAAIQQDP